MQNLEFSGLLAVAAVAFLIPFVLGLVPRLRLPASVLEVVAGILLGPAGFGWVKPDVPVQVFSLSVWRFCCSSLDSRLISSTSEVVRCN